MGRGQRLRVGLLLAAIIAANASYTVLIPFVPALQDRLQLSGTEIALTFALFAAGKAAAQPVGGVCSDRWSPRWVGFGALWLVAVGVALLATAQTAAVLLLARTLWGIGEGLLTPALYHGATLLCDRYGITANRMMAWFGSSSVFGFLVGPLVAGLAAPLGLTVLCLAGAVASVLTGFGVAAAIPASRAGAARAGRRTPATSTPAAPAAPAAAGAGWLGLVFSFGLLDLFTNVSYSALEPTLPLYLASGDSGPVTTVISVVFVLGLATFGLVSWVLGRYVERRGIDVLIAGGLAIGAVGLAGLSASPDVVPVALCFMIIMVSQPMLYLAARRGIAEMRADGRPLGRWFGIFGAVSDVGNLCGPLVGVALYEWTGRYGFLVLGTASAVLLAGLRWWRRRGRADAGRAPSGGEPGEAGEPGGAGGEPDESGEPGGERGGERAPVSSAVE